MIFMNVIRTRIDSKGRISIPYHIRTSLGIDESSRMKISANEREIFLIPSVEGVKTRIRFGSFSAMLKMMKIFSDYKINMANVNIVNFDRNNIEWSAVLESNNETLKNVFKKVRKIRNVRNLEFLY